MPKIPKKTRQIVGIASLASVVAIISISYLLFWDVSLDRFNDFLFVAILVGIIPSAALDEVNESWKRAINTRLPQVVRDLSESQDTGMTLIRALDEAAKRKYGPLSLEVKKLSHQMSWGSSFEEALTRFAKHIGTSIVRRFSVLVLEASTSGGRIRNVFTMTAESMEETLHLNSERSSQMRPYMIIIYAAYFVFLFTTLVLLTSFFTPLAEVPTAGHFFSVGTQGMFQEFFFHMLMIQAILGGVVAGKMGEGRILSGLKHAIILLIAGFTVFKLAVP